MMCDLEPEDSIRWRASKEDMSNQSNDSATGIMGEQLSLFDEKNVLSNTGASELIRLNLEGARKAFQSYQDIYRDGNDIEVKLKITAFLLDGFVQCPADSPEEPAYLYRLWNSFEKYASEISFNDESILSGIKDSFFQKIIEAISRWDLADMPFFLDNVPMGCVYMEAGNIDQAIASLQASIPVTENNAALYGYLGDAYMLRGEPEVARRCYLEALLADAGSIDWNYLKDEELANLREELIEAFDMNEPLAAEWLSTHAFIRGLLQSRTLRLREEMKYFVDEYQELRKAYSREPDPRLGAKLFIRSIILCDNEPFIKLIKGIELVEIRKKMKEIDPELFSQYMKCINSRKSHTPSGGRS